MRRTLELTSILFLFIFFTACETQTTCDISGNTIACSSGLQHTYTYTTDIANPDITWSTTDGIAILDGQGTSNLIVQFPVGFTTGSISAIGVGSETCSETILISCDDVDGGENNTCNDPAPVIDPQICVSGGHPYWRFQVNGISASDQITWSINHGEVITGVNSDYAIIDPNEGSEAGFTVYCEVTRTCPNGTTVVVTAYYTNYYGNDCDEGTGGILN